MDSGAQAGSSVSPGLRRMIRCESGSTTACRFVTVVARGCPWLLFHTEMTATSGSSALRNAGLLIPSVSAPWWSTRRTSTSRPMSLEMTSFNTLSTSPSASEPR